MTDDDIVTHMLPDDVLNEFANTYEELHYIVVSLAIGFLLGLEYYRRFIDS